jgi:polyketide biosynthesis enoyl-CoA hydratase PksI
MTEVVKLVYPEPAIAMVSLEDRESRNTFSRRLIEGLLAAFKEIQQNNQVKVVIVHGYENYFCCGGTQEELLDIYLGKLNFTDLSFYRLLLDCEVPTIAAMQGHAIGGGLAFGCYADHIILAEECIYSTNFMKYGFTPGMGATYMVPKKLGESLGNELLYTANTYHGGTLKQRGVSVPVVKKAEVLNVALELAKQLADKPCLSLKLLKSHLTQEIRKQLPTIIEAELAMHKTTFAQQEVKERIETLFGA